MFKFWKGREKNKSAPEGSSASVTDIQVSSEEKIVELKGRTVQRHVAPVIGMTIVDLANQNEVDWNSFCKRGTCARCRCLVSEGMEYLSVPNEAEEMRLDPEEIDEGYRLGCQTKLEKIGVISIKHAPYF
ncbi:2Fe-2S iron-sulfur cluster-binding protein [Paenibacillus dakarensis]|uniref:2Fe-2S iron-sulfur cluster-binding protein n=1 Tax=Paenibacillus dakarensis TaxID=1527293 RepID=UPI0006D55DC0|nr:2Fe-2S iron-sulfur cluster-binding protein [Paenibacillus dakarensis]